MKKRILWHLKICEEIKNAGLPWDFIKKYKGEQLHQASKLINMYTMQETVKRMKRESLEYLVKDAEFIRYLYKLYQKRPETEVSRIEALIGGAGEEKLSGFSLEKIEMVMEDEAIRSDMQFWYLKYYFMLVLDSDKKSALMNGLLNWRNNAELDLKELSQEERNLLMEPAFSNSLLLPIYEEGKAWKQLLEPEKLKLVNGIASAAWTWQQLQSGQFLELMEKPGEFRSRFLHVTGYMEKESISAFVELWIMNNALINDLKRLEQILPDMDREQIDQMLQDRASYVSVLYRERVQEIPLQELPQKQRDVIFYAVITNKKQFLALVRDSYEDFACLPYHSFLLNPDVYQKYLNLNTLNRKNLKECFGLEALSKQKKQIMERTSYTFEELRLLASLGYSYCVLYNKLAYERSDDRLRVFRELAKRKCIPCKIEEDEITYLGERLSQKTLSIWMQEELGHIKHLRYQTAVLLLAHWEELKPFISGINDENQVLYLLRNRDCIKEFHDFSEIQKHIMESDQAWGWMRDNLPIEDEFVQEHKENIFRFLYEGGSEILYAFCKKVHGKKEEIRRLLTAEFMGKFMELKYHEDNLEKEIAYPITAEIKRAWMENMELSRGCYHVWEEDRLLPVMQIGEIPTETCMSYRNGAQCECLLSCFDSNKKIVFLEKDGDIVFRAILPLTKGSHNKIDTDSNRVEFADLTKIETAKNNAKEELVLFLERPYYKRISDEEAKKAVSHVVRMVKQKAEAVGAKLVLSTSYGGMLDVEEFELANYYVYISASKNGSQYLDSLGGMATVNNSGSYGRARVFLR